jgi:hypothetical protein
MSKLVVCLEPFGNQELGIGEMLDPSGKEVSYVLVMGEGEIPVPVDDDIELMIYQEAGHEIRDTDELWDFQCDNHDAYIPTNLDKYTEKAIEWWEQRGYTAEKLPVLHMVSPL